MLWGYGLLFFAKNTRKNIDENVIKNLRGLKKSLDHAKKSARDALKTSSKIKN